MLRRLDANIAAIPSSYGPGFSKTPIHRKMRDLAISLVPVWARIERNRMINMLQLRQQPIIPTRFRERFKPQIDFLKSVELPIYIDSLFEDIVSRDRMLYISEYLYRNHNRLEVK